MIYHLTYQNNLDGKILYPSVPSNYMTQNGFEDNITARICVTLDIGLALRAMTGIKPGVKLYVNTPAEDRYLFRPGKDLVPDVEITNEFWILAPTKMKCIGAIEIVGPLGDDEGIPYTYGDNQVAALYDWEWKWVERNTMP